MSNPVSNDELDWLIWRDLRDQDGHPTNNADLVTAAGGKWRRIDSRIQAMRRAGRLKFWHWRPRPPPTSAPTAGRCSAALAMATARMGNGTGARAATTAPAALGPTLLMARLSRRRLWLLNVN